MNKDKKPIRYWTKDDVEKIASLLKRIQKLMMLQLEEIG